LFTPSLKGDTYAKYADDKGHGHGDYKKGINHGSPPTIIEFFADVIQVDIIKVSPLGSIASPITFDGATSRVNVNVRTTPTDRDLRPEIVPVTGYNVIDV